MKIRLLFAILLPLAFMMSAIACSSKEERPDPEDIFRIPENKADADTVHHFSNVDSLMRLMTDFVISIDESSSRMITPSVKESVLEMRTSHTLPLVMCVMEINLADPFTRIEVTYPEGANTTWPVRNMVKQAQAIDSNGHRVVGAINADFFYMSDTGFPLGGVWHDGKVVKSDFSSDWTYFEIDWKGVASMGTRSEYEYLNKSEIRELVGSHYVLVRGGTVNWFTENYRAPRTAVGISKDGLTVYMVVVDELVPNDPRDGINFEDLAKVMRQIGSWDAVNMDGGGSSTFVVRDGDDFLVKNKQAGAYLRPVADGLAVIYIK